jgi:hypothetical protein
MSDKHEQFLLAFCVAIHRAEKMAQEERKKELLGDGFFPELLLNKNEKVRIEIRKENVSHNAPHIHITHSDKIDASISLLNFGILAGNIDRKTYKHLLCVIVPNKDKLLEIWGELNEKDNSIGAEKLISSLGLSLG